MSHQLQEAIKVKSTKAPGPETQSSANARTTPAERQPTGPMRAQAHIARPTMYKTPTEGDSIPSKAELIKAKVYFGDQVVHAIIDTGSQLNIVNRDFWKKYINVPRDITQQILLEDANGGEGQLDGVVKEVKINMGSLFTKVNLYVGVKSPFDLLLGCPWQRVVLLVQAEEVLHHTRVVLLICTGEA